MTRPTFDMLNALLEKSRAFGFLGPGPTETHRKHAEAYLPLLPMQGTVVDMGSGGGIPGLILALGRPDLSFVLLDAMIRRTVFLIEAVDSLSLANTQVVTARAEEFARADVRHSCSAVVARSFGTPAVLAECAAPLLCPDGVLIVAEPDQADSSRWPEEGLSLLGLEKGEAVSEPVHLQVLRSAVPCPEAYPRRVGVPSKRPLW